MATTVFARRLKCARSSRQAALENERLTRVGREQAPTWHASRILMQLTLSGELVVVSTSLQQFVLF